jgi:hypothetical protein
MDKREANIDLVFRNGLKDLEVLPPAGVWDNIHPIVQSRTSSFSFARAAALVAVLMSIGFFAYRMSLNVSEVLENRVTAFNIAAAYPIYEKIQLSEPVAADAVRSGSNTASPIFRIFSDRTDTDERAAEISYNSVGTLNNVEAAGDSEKYAYEGLRMRHNASSGNQTYVYEELKNPEIDLQAVEKNKNRWSLGAIASPTYFGMIGSGDNESTSQLKSMEQSVTSYTGGIAFTYKLSRRFSIQSGLYYSSLGQEVEGINSFGGFQKYDFTKGSRNFEVLTSSGKIFTNNSDVFLLAEGPDGRVITNFTSDLFDPKKANLQYINNTILQSFSYLELPLILRYKFVDRTIDLNLIGGVSYNMLLGNNVYANLEGGKYPIGKTEGLSPISISSSLGMGMEYSFSKSFSLNLEPTFRYYLNPFNELAGSTMHPYSFGIFSGLTYKF